MKLYHILKILVAINLFICIQPAAADNTAFGTDTMKVSVTDKYQENIGGGKSYPVEEGSNQETSGIKYIIAEKTRYEILETTEISMQGKFITADSLPVPCNSLISYQILKNGTRNLLSLKVLRTLPDSTTNWSELLAD